MGSDSQLATTLFLVGVVAYAVAATSFYLLLVGQGDRPRKLRWGRDALVVAALAHGAHIVVRSLKERACPVESVEFALSLISLVVVVSFTLVARRSRIGALGAMIAPLCLAAMVAAQFVGGGQFESQAPTWLLALHVTSNLIGIALFILAAVAGGAYLVQASRLKAKRPLSAEAVLPGLSTLERLVRRSLAIGFAPLTIGVVSGAVFASRTALSGVGLLRGVLSYGVWTVVGVLVVLGRVVGWRGRTMAWGAILGALGGLIVVFLYILAQVPGGGD